MTTIKLGLVGLGKIARDQHLPAIAQTDGIELVAVASRNSAIDGLACYHDIHAMLEGEPDIDAIILCQPPQARFEAARLALEAGKHVFLEKPPGATLSEVEALIAIAVQHGCTLFASWHSREAAAVRSAREFLVSAKIRSVHVVWKEDVRVWHPGQEWIWEPGGFGVFDPGINALSILTHIMPAPIRLKSAQLEIPSNRASPVAANLEMSLYDDVPITAEFDFLQSGLQSWDIQVQTSQGELLLKNGGNDLLIDGKMQAVGQEQEYASLYHRFNSLVKQRQNDVDLAPLRLVADAFMTGRWTSVEPFIE